MAFLFRLLVLALPLAFLLSITLHALNRNVPGVMHVPKSCSDKQYPSESGVTPRGPTEPTACDIGDGCFIQNPLMRIALPFGESFVKAPFAIPGEDHICSGGNRAYALNGLYHYVISLLLLFGFDRLRNKQRKSKGNSKS